MQLKILSWNILQGGGSRITELINAVHSLSPNFIIFSEFKANISGSKILLLLKNIGYSYFYYYEKNTTENSVLIASKTEGKPINLSYEISEAFLQNIVSVDFNGFAISGVYLPHKKKHKLFSTLETLILDQSKYHIIAGDFNTGINHIDQLGDSFWYEDEFKNLCSNLMSDAFRLLNPNAAEFSWYSHQKNGFRYDHTLIDKRIESLVKSCEYLHSFRESKLSDHSPMLLTLEP